MSVYLWPSTQCCIPGDQTSRIFGSAIALPSQLQVCPAANRSGISALWLGCTAEGKIQLLRFFFFFFLLNKIKIYWLGSKAESGFQKLKGFLSYLFRIVSRCHPPCCLVFWPFCLSSCIMMRSPSPSHACRMSASSWLHCLLMPT